MADYSSMFVDILKNPDYLLGNKIVNALLVFGKTELNGAVFRYNGDGTVSTDSAQTMEDAIYAEGGGF